MKIYIAAVILFFSQWVFAGTGFEEVGKLFDSGKKIEIKNIKTSNQGIYTGRCFNYYSSTAYSSFLTFKNLSENSGPLPIDPDLLVSWGLNDSPDYYDKVNVKDFVNSLIFIRTYSDEEVIGARLYEYTYDWKKSEEYIVQENRKRGFIYSYCYYYQFRDLK